jgi:hypothetical protein
MVRVGKPAIPIKKVWIWAEAVTVTTGSLLTYVYLIFGTGAETYRLELALEFKANSAVPMVVA